MWLVIKEIWKLGIVFCFLDLKELVCKMGVNIYFCKEIKFYEILRERRLVFSLLEVLVKYLVIMWYLVFVCSRVWNFYLFVVLYLFCCVVGGGFFCFFI